MRRDKDFILYGLGEEDYAARGLLLLAGLYFGSLLFAAILSPFAYRVTQHLGDSWSLLASRPFPDYFDRFRLLGLLAIAPWLFKSCKLWPCRKIGFKRERALSLLATMFVAGVLMVVATFAVQYALGTVAFQDRVEVGNVAEKLLVGVLAGVTVALIEETLFRALVLRIFYTALRPMPAVLLSAAVFAAMHFKMADDLASRIQPGGVGLLLGLRSMLDTMMAPFAGFNGMMFLNLLLIGVLLNIAFLATSNLWVGIGLHAGWIAAAATSQEFLETVGNETWFLGWSVTLELVVFVVLGLGLWRRAQGAVRSA
jgi:membrane protease YdiL (CAAX protease family)